MGLAQGALMVGEVAGEEDDQAEFGQLGGLEADGDEADVEGHPEPGPSLFQAAEGEPPSGRQVGQQEQADRHQ